MKFLILLLLQSSTTYYLWIATGVPVDPSKVVVEGFGYHDLRVVASSTQVTIRWKADRPCFDVFASGPRVVGRYTELSGCERVTLPLVTR